MPLDPQPIVTVINEHWPQVVFGYAVLRDAAKPITKYLQDHFRHASPETLQQAANNASDLAHRVEAKVQQLLQRGDLTEQQLRDALDRPDIATMLRDTFTAGSETSSEFQHEQFATLIAKHLAAKPESLQSKVLRMASERVRYLTDQQLITLGLMHVLTSVRLEQFTRATLEERLTEYSGELNAVLAPYDDVRVRLVDIEYMEGVSLLSINWSAVNAPRNMRPPNETSTQLLVPLHTEFYGVFPPLGPHAVPDAIRKINAWMIGDRDIGEAGVRGITLTMPGNVIASAVHANYMAQPLDISWLL